ncbi:hypothetical protein GCM10020331_010040 [Ectobacillus funiculus]
MWAMVMPKSLKTAGALVSHPFGSIMRSILVAVYELGADEVCVVGHYDCGMASLKSREYLEKNERTRRKSGEIRDTSLLWGEP